MVKNQKIGILIGIFLSFALVGCGQNTAEFVDSMSSIKSSGMETETMDEEETSETKEAESLYVYVCGAVTAPGVYVLPAGSRVCDLFEMAQGLTREAAQDYWNQARLLADGEMLYVPTKEEAEELSDREWDVAGGLGTAEKDSSAENEKVNINTASKEELMTLPGIGESKALAILEYRKQKGRFTSVEELKEIPGIKDGVYAKIKEYITVN